MSPARFELGWYNGWSLDERRATVAVQRDAVATGALPRPTTCSICQAHGSPANPVWFHDEDYADPLAAYAVCRSCHRTLHQRFDDPAPWLALVERYRQAGSWFAMLSMNPISQHRPFVETYPTACRLTGAPGRLHALERGGRIRGGCA